MPKVKVLLEPVMADRAYMAGEELDLSETDAAMLARWGIVEILQKTNPKAKAKHTKPETEAESEYDQQTPPEP